MNYFKGFLVGFLMMISTIFVHSALLGRHKMILMQNLDGCTLEAYLKRGENPTYSDVKECLNNSSFEYRVLGTLLFSEGSFLVEE